MLRRKWLWLFLLCVQLETEFNEENEEVEGEVVSGDVCQWGIEWIRICCHSVGEGTVIGSNCVTRLLKTLPVSNDSLVQESDIEVMKPSSSKKTPSEKCPHKTKNSTNKTRPMLGLQLTTCMILLLELQRPYLFSVQGQLLLTICSHN
jgi:hypothetical protein